MTDPPRQCGSCDVVAATRYCRCEQIQLCYRCALTALHQANCVADQTAMGAFRAGRSDYPTERTSTSRNP